MFRVTKKWLDSNKTKAGGYTAKQLNVFGFGFPPPKGWKQLLIGMTTTLSRKIEFEESSLGKRSNNLIHAKKVAYSLTPSDRIELVKYIKRLDSQCTCI